MAQLVPTLQLIFSALHSVTVGRYCITAAYAILFYDWIISLDKEVAFIYPAPWNAVNIAYIFCRYYPLAISPFLYWGFLGDHDRSVCQLYYHALYTCVMPTTLSAQFILMLRSYAFSGRKRPILFALSISFSSIVGYVVWVLSRQLSLTALFMIKENSGCFATSNQPASPLIVEAVGAYQLGIISILTCIFDCLNMFVVIRHCVRERSTLGPLGQSFLKQGVLVYVIMTILNALTIGTFFTSHLLDQGVGSWFAYILPSALSCRLVLMLRRKASPTETELQVQYSHMVDEALEMIDAETLPGNIPESFIPSLQSGAQPQP
ncbi:hypothetical protein BJV74DRAFT_383274 [Russula compacta]|nr:hypothetical protein BJV74DRAFT_383274 [Russula compacta]